MKGLAIVVCAMAAVSAVSVAIATNGMNMIGYDAVSAGLGGADVAIETGCTAVASNPANLTTMAKQSFAANVSLLSPRLSFKNSTMSGVNDMDGEVQVFPLPFIGYGARIGGSGVTWGLAFFAQGGMGVDFQDVRTNFGTRDDIYSNVRYMRLAPTVAYELTDKLALGATLHVGYSDIAYKFFPETSYYDPGADGAPMTADDMVFPGQELAGAGGMGYAARIGLRYEISPELALGASYSTKANLTYEDGDLDMNFSSMGLGKVRYEGEVEGFSWPAAAEIGAAFKLLDAHLILSTELQWIGWSSALETVTVTGKSPNNAYAPATVEIPFAFNWDDQFVFAFGACYSVSENGKIRGGWNYGKSPIPDKNVYPLFPATIEHHLSLGYGHTFGHMTVDLTYEHGVENEVTNPNADPMTNPFGPDDTTTHAQNTLHMTVSYRI